MDLTLPYVFEGTVVRGFGRGGKELGCPTANLDEDVVEKLPENLRLGVYYGLASLKGTVYTMAMSVGWNPHYKNEKKTLEANLVGYSGPDFYGENIKGLIVGFIREMKSFSSIEELKQVIADDIRIAQDRTAHVDDLKSKFFPPTSHI